MRQARGQINPYVYGKAISNTNAKLFYGRHNLIEDIVGTLTKTQQNFIVLHGQPRIGKSSLLYRLQRDEILQNTHIPVVFDLQQHEGFSTVRILASLAQRIAEKVDVNLPFPTEAEIADDPNKFKKDFLVSIFDRLEDKRLLLLFDEFDVAIPPDTSNLASVETFPGYLRAVINEEQEQMAFVFVVSKRLDLLPADYHRLFKGAHTQPVGRLEKPDTFDLLVELGRQGQIEYTPAALEEIWALTNGHPYMTQLIGSEVFDRLQKGGKQQAEVPDVEACLTKAMEHGEGALVWFWKGFEKEERLVLSAVADLTDRHKGVSDQEIDETLKKNIIILTPLARDKAYKPLLQGDFLIETERHCFKFAVEFIRQWIVKNHPIKEAKREIEEMNPEAMNYYDLGQRAFTRGDMAEAIKHYRLAIEKNAYFTQAYIDLGSALRANKNIPEAITEYEHAYRLDPAQAREDLIELREIYLDQVKTSNDPESTLEQAWRILEIDPEHMAARQLVSQIFLARIAGCLEDDELDQAAAYAKQLVQPVPIIEDTQVSQSIRDMWLKYSQSLTEQQPPQWDEAQHVLDGLAELDPTLFNEAIRIAFNNLTLAKARARLRSDAVEPALTILENELKDPRPAQDIKELLLGYSKQQIVAQRWQTADITLQKLYQLVSDEHSAEAVQSLYRQWGDAFLSDRKFDEAIDIYRRGQPQLFNPKIVQAYLQKAERNLAQSDLSQARSSYQQALRVENSEAIQTQARGKLVGFFESFRKEQAWLLAGDTLAALIDLDLTGNDAPTLAKELKMDQAKDNLARHNIDAAFHHLEDLDAIYHDEVKTLIKNYFQQAARVSEWNAGAEAINRLQTLLAVDPEVQVWHANWRFLWAKALFPTDKLDKDPKQSKELCFEIITNTPEDIPLLQLIGSPDSAIKAETDQFLHPSVCELIAKIALEQAQSALNEDNLSEARQFFEEALALPNPPKNVKEEVHTRLAFYSREQFLKEKVEEGRSALKIAQHLEVGDLDEQVKQIAITEVRDKLKANKLDEAFRVLDRYETDITDKERDDIKVIVCLFSRLFAGRDLWPAAKQVLVKLQAWLTDDIDDIQRLRDALNWEHLNFIKGRRAPTPVDSKEINRLQEEGRVAEEGYREARLLELDSLNTWTDEFVRTSLQLGQSYLDNGSLDPALKVYKRILDVESQLNHREQIGQSLHNYSDRVLTESQDWPESLKTLEQLKLFNLLAPDNTTQPDPRADGAIHRVILSQTNALLDQDGINDTLIKDTFARLIDLPRPRPTGEIKTIVLDYSQKYRDQNDWENAVVVLNELDQFLLTDHRESDREIRDQEALGELVNTLEAWGQYLEHDHSLEKAAEVYHRALSLTRQAARRRNIELAGHFVRVKLQLAQICLHNDSFSSVTPDVIDQALEGYQVILALEECTPDYEQKINEALYQHADKLAEQRRWERARDILDRVDSLYPPAPENKYKTLFAGWRKELELKEVTTWLEARQDEKAFVSLERLRDWLKAYNAPKITWRTTTGEVKNLVNDYCQSWLDEENWPLATRTLSRLAELIANDDKIIGWEVTAYRRWGEWLQQKARLSEAVAQFKQALEKTPDKEKSLRDEIEQSLLDTQLAYALTFLNQHQLKPAVNIYGELLQQPHDYLDRADGVRRALKRYSDQLIDQPQPNWDNANQALEALLGLGLDDEQVFGWRQELNLRRMKEALLTFDNLDAAFDTLRKIDQPWPMDQIQNLVRQYRETRAGMDTFHFALQALERFGQAIDGEQVQARQWVARELVRLGDDLEKQDNLSGAGSAYELAGQFANS
ncbi:MAG: hypothetical protein KDI79_30910 [Anaerolineae bacterium]|nr:hypothetical protein [Anaerolineae bacterium]